MTLKEFMNEVEKHNLFDHLSEIKKKRLLSINNHVLVVFLHNSGIPKGLVTKKIFIELISSLPYMSNEADLNKLYEIFQEREYRESYDLVIKSYDTRDPIRDEIYASVEVAMCKFETYVVENIKNH